MAANSLAKSFRCLLFLSWHSPHYELYRKYISSQTFPVGIAPSGFPDKKPEILKKIFFYSVDAIGFFNHPLGVGSASSLRSSCFIFLLSSIKAFDPITLALVPSSTLLHPHGSLFHVDDRSSEFRFVHSGRCQRIYSCICSHAQHRNGTGSPEIFTSG